MIKNKEPQKGQSMVEMAIILPIFLLMLLGVFEVGWALRGYLTLTNANREAARFAARGVYLDFDKKDDLEAVGYDKIIIHTEDSLSGQLANMDIITGVNPAVNAGIIVTYYSVEPRIFTCPDDADCDTFDCSKFLDPTYDGTTDESGFDMAALNDIEYPLLVPVPGFPEEEHEENYVNYYGKLPAYYYYEGVNDGKIPQDTHAGLDVDHTEAITTYYFYAGGQFYSRINPEEKVAELQGQANQLNCELQKKGQTTSDNKVVIVENIFNQDQLASLPFVTLFVPDPIPLYTYTAMRVSPPARKNDEEENEICSLYPIMIPTSELTGKQYGEDTMIPIDAIYHDVPGHFGFIQWNSQASVSDALLEDNLLNPDNAAENFMEPDSNPSDTSVNIGNWITAFPGTNTAATDELEGLIGTEMLFPVWNDADCLTSGQGNCSNAVGSGPDAKYRTFTFVRMFLTEVNFDGVNCDNPGQQCLKFQFLAFDADACPEIQD